MKSLTNIHSEQHENFLIIKNENTTTNNSDATLKEIIPGPQIDYYKYGVVHLNMDPDLDYDRNDPHYADNVFSEYMRNYSAIEYGIYRYFASESQIKSDLQTYNKDQFDLVAGGYSYDILAYSMITHDNGDETPDWELWKWNKFLGIKWLSVASTLTACEVENLWYEYSITKIYPTDTIVFAHTCYGWSWSSNTMAEAFVDYGASAFVATEQPASIFIENSNFQDPARVFWEGLCQNDDTVGIALNDYTDALTGLNPPVYEAPYWHIYGDSSATLED